MRAASSSMENGLGHIVVRARVQPCDLGAGIVQGGEGDHREAGCGQTDLAEHVEASHARQDEVEQDHIDVECAGELDPPRARHPPW